MLIDSVKPLEWDERRRLIVPGDHNTTLTFCVQHFISVCRHAIEHHGYFFAALSGGSTPKALFERLTTPPYASQIDWQRVVLFWSDERAVPPGDSESNYRMAMEAGLGNMGIPASQIHRMRAESSIGSHALEYEKEIQRVLQGAPFDLMMLGMGEDGHTASLFPNTEGLHANHRLAIANFIPQKNTWRMTLTFDCINAASHIAVYVLGASKKHTLSQVLNGPCKFDLLPSQRVGTKEHPALWIADEAAAGEVNVKQAGRASCTR
jgi:6-phosphogluconolactonase